MSAPVKVSVLSQNARTEIATDLTHRVLADLKHNKEHCKIANLTLNVVGHGIRPFGQHSPNDYIDFSITHGKSTYIGLGSQDVVTIGSMIKNIIKSQQPTAEIVEGDEYGFPSQVKLFTKPCKEFNKLNKYLSTHGTSTIDLKTWFIVDLFGKRGHYDEYGDRKYFCYSPNLCNSILEKAKKIYKRGSKIEVKLKTLDDMDNLDNSIYYETECYGVRTIEIVLNLVQ